MENFENLTDAQITRRQLLRIEKTLETIKGMGWVMMGAVVAGALKLHGWW